MRTLARNLAAVVLAALVVLVPAAAAPAKQPPNAGRWAKRHHLKGHWRGQDADHDGLSNLREFKLKTDPRRADSDRDGLKDADELRAGDDPLVSDSDGDGVKDGAEHAGVVTAFDGATITVRQFHGPLVTATVDEAVDCHSADDADSTDDPTSADDSTADDTTADDGAADDASSTDEVDLTGDSSGDTEPTCADLGVVPGAVVSHLELDRDDAGNLVVYEIELAG